MDAEPVRAHVRGLMDDYKMPIERIATQVGVSRSGVESLLYGASSRVTIDNGQRLLTAHFDLDLLKDSSLVNSVGTRRRVQGLAVIGYGVSAQARLLDRNPQNFHHALCSSVVRADLARAVRELADRLETIPPPIATTSERISVHKARRQAAREGWAPLAAWDDIDNPRDVPATANLPDIEPDPAVIAILLRGVSAIKDFRRVDVYGAILRLLRDGKGPSTIAKLFNSSGSTVNRLIAETKRYEHLAALAERDALTLPLLRQPYYRRIHILPPIDTAATTTESCAPLCSYPGVGELVSRMNTGDVLCLNCRRAVGPFWARVPGAL